MGLQQEQGACRAAAGSIVIRTRGCGEAVCHWSFIGALVPTLVPTTSHIAAFEARTSPRPRDTPRPTSRPVSTPRPTGKPLQAGETPRQRSAAAAAAPAAPTAPLPRPSPCSATISRAMRATFTWCCSSWSSAISAPPLGPRIKPT